MKKRLLTFEWANNDFQMKKVLLLLLLFILLLLLMVFLSFLGIVSA